MLLGTPCNHFVAIIDQSNGAMSFVITAYPVSWTAPANQCHYLKKVRFSSGIHELTAGVFCLCQLLCHINEFLCHH